MKFNKRENNAILKGNREIISTKPSSQVQEYPFWMKTEVSFRIQFIEPKVPKELHL
jgi:hypothetical protein